MTFWLHFTIINYDINITTYDNSISMSSLFRANLKGNDFYLNPLEIAYGSRVTLKNSALGGYLLNFNTKAHRTDSEQKLIGHFQLVF